MCNTIMGNKNSDIISIRKTKKQYNFKSQKYGKITLKHTLKEGDVNSFTRLE